MFFSTSDISLNPCKRVKPFSSKKKELWVCSLLRSSRVLLGLVTQKYVLRLRVESQQKERILSKDGGVVVTERRTAQGRHKVMEPDLKEQGS